MYVAPFMSECSEDYEPVIGVIYEKPSCSDGFVHFFLRPMTNELKTNKLIVLPNNHVRFQIIENTMWENIYADRPHATMKAYFVDY